MVAAGNEPLGVLVVCGGGFQGLALARTASQVANVRVVVFDSLPHPVTGILADDVVEAPPLEHVDEFVKRLREVVLAKGIRLVLPSTERELPLLAALDASSLGDARIAVSDAAALDRFSDRSSLQLALVEAGLPTLPALDMSEVRVCDLPVLGKPKRGSWGGRGHLVARSAEDLDRFAASIDADEYLWQPLLEGFREYSIDFAVGFAGELSPVLIRERLRTTGGFCVVAQGSAEGEVGELAERAAQFVARAGGRGIFNVQCLERDSRRWISDVNPRVGTSAVFALGAGVNLVEFLLRSPQHGGGASTVEASEQMRMTRVLEERFLPIGDPPIRALLFDLDDTLLDHKLWIFAKFEKLWLARREELPPREIFLRAAWRAIEEGDRARTIDIVMRDLSLPAALREPLIVEYRRSDPAEAPLYPDVLGALAAFRDRGLRLAMVTDNPPASQRQKLARAGLERSFDAVVFTREFGGEKPEPAGLHAALAQLGVPAGEAAMVGDQPLRDGEAARVAGLRRFFWMRRGGGLFDVHAGLMERLAPELARFTVAVRDLRELAEAVGRR